jgi:sirohydrochlorin ferrochelatase
LELAEPTINAAVERLARRGLEQWSVMPLLLFAAGHAKQDIPRAVAAAAGAKQPVHQYAHLGCHAKLLELSALRFAEAVESVGNALRGVPTHQLHSAERQGGRSLQERSEHTKKTTLILVGRGSRDAGATAEMFRFAELRHKQARVARTEVCFVAMAEPPLDECLDKAARSDAERIVVQPHLLFGGRLLASLSARVDAMARRHPEKEWLTTRHLGPHPLLDEAILDILAQPPPTNK